MAVARQRFAAPPLRPPRGSARCVGGWRSKATTHSAASVFEAARAQSRREVAEAGPARLDAEQARARFVSARERVSERRERDLIHSINSVRNATALGMCSFPTPFSCVPCVAASSHGSEAAGVGKEADGVPARGFRLASDNAAIGREGPRGVSELRWCAWGPRAREDMERWLVQLRAAAPRRGARG